MSQSSSVLKMVSWMWLWVYCAHMASAVARSQSNRTPLWECFQHHKKLKAKGGLTQEYQIKWPLSILFKLWWFETNQHNCSAVSFEEGSVVITVIKTSLTQFPYYVLLLKEPSIIYKWLKIRAFICWKHLYLWICRFKKGNLENSQLGHSLRLWSVLCPYTAPIVWDWAYILFQKWPLSSCLPFSVLFDSVAQVRAPALKMMSRIESRSSRLESRQIWSLWRLQKVLQFLGSLQIQLMVLVFILQRWWCWCNFKW